MNNLFSYCWLTDARMRASEKDLPVHWSNSRGTFTFTVYTYVADNFYLSSFLVMIVTSLNKYCDIILPSKKNPFQFCSNCHYCHFCSGLEWPSLTQIYQWFFFLGTSWWTILPKWSMDKTSPLSYIAFSIWYKWVLISNNKYFFHKGIIFAWCT